MLSEPSSLPIGVRPVCSCLAFTASTASDAGSPGHAKYYCTPGQKDPTCILYQLLSNPLPLPRASSIARHQVTIDPRPTLGAIKSKVASFPGRTTRWEPAHNPTTILKASSTILNRFFFKLLS